MNTYTKQPKNMQYPKTIPPSNNFNTLRVLGSHVGPDFADGVNLSRYNNTGKSSLKLKSHAVSPKSAPF